MTIPHLLSKQTPPHLSHDPNIMNNMTVSTIRHCHVKQPSPTHWSKTPPHLPHNPNNLDDMKVSTAQTLLHLPHNPNIPDDMEASTTQCRHGGTRNPRCRMMGVENQALTWNNTKAQEAQHPPLPIPQQNNKTAGQTTTQQTKQQNGKPNDNSTAKQQHSYQVTTQLPREQGGETKGEVYVLIFTFLIFLTPSLTISILDMPTPTNHHPPIAKGPETATSLANNITRAQHRHSGRCRGANWTPTHQTMWRQHQGAAIPLPSQLSNAREWRTHRWHWMTPQ